MMTPGMLVMPQHILVGLGDLCSRVLEIGPGRRERCQSLSDHQAAVVVPVRGGRQGCGGRTRGIILAG